MLARFVTARVEPSLAAERDRNSTQLINLPEGRCTEAHHTGVLAGQPEAALEYVYGVG